jgi:DNA sulfur modification protein DndE
MKKREMIMQRTLLVLLLSILFFWLVCSDKNIRIYLIGDSTMANKPIEDNPERGWGQVFSSFFSDKVTVHNHAKNGRSTKSFIDEGRWQAVFDSLQSGDYVMIQFGHNDQKEYDSTRFAAPHGAYKTNLEKFVLESRSKGTHPILITPVVRRRFNERGQFYDTHGDYPEVVREVARKMNVPLIDLHQASCKLITSLGEKESKKIFLWVEPGHYSRFPEGKQDNTHFSEYGACEVAALVVQGIRELNLDLNKYIKP